MKDKKILIAIILAVIVGLLFFFSSRPVKKNGRRLDADITQEVNIAKLESQVQQLRGLLTAFVGLNRSLNDSFQKESAQRKSLEHTLGGLNGQYESLIKELNQTKVSLELTLPIKQRIDTIGAELAALNVGPGKEKELKIKLQDIHTELKLIDAQIPALLKENASYKRLSESLQGLVDKQNEEAVILRNTFNEERGRAQAHKKELEGVSRRAQDLEKIKNNLMQTNVSLYTEINRLNKELKDIQMKLSRLRSEKDTAAKQKDEALRLLEHERLRFTQTIGEAKTAMQNNQQLIEQLHQLKNQLAQVQKDSDNLKIDFRAAQDTLKNNEAELGRRADKILVLEEKLSGLQIQLAQIQSQHNELLKDSASLREQNVAVQLEKEELKEQWHQAALKASDLENQLAQISTILKVPKPAGTPLPKEEAKEESKRVEVELYPAQNTDTQASK